MSETALHSPEDAKTEADQSAGQRWLAHMLAGNFTDAWRESDEIRRRGNPDPHRFWQGDDLRHKRVVLRCLHGYGDAVQFLRYVPQLRGLVSQLTVEVPPAMLEVAPCFEGVQQVITWGAHAPVQSPAWDFQVEVMELPYVFQTNLQELPIATNYLRLPAAIEHRAAHILGRPDVPRVGIVWAGGDWSRERSLPVSLLRSLLETPGCEFWNLQGGRARDELREFPWAANVRDAEICRDGILPLTAAISQLDLIITVDTLAAHLAGALGKRVWILLPHVADWRWMMGRSDSPWYPSARLFRQTSPGEWGGVIDSVQRHLAEVLKAAGTAALNRRCLC